MKKMFRSVMGNNAGHRPCRPVPLAVLLGSGQAQAATHAGRDLVSPFKAGAFSGMAFGRLNAAYLSLLYEVAEYCHPENGKKRFKMFCRGVLWPKISGQWFHQVAQSPLLSELVQRQKRLAEIPHRPVLRLDNKAKKRLEIVSGHYSAIDRLFAQEFLRQVLLTEEGFLLAQVEHETDDIYQLSLRYVTHPGKEGELAICWHRQQGGYLAQVIFSVLPSADGLSIYIGGIQGAGGDYSRERVSAACKAFSGLSPLRIVVEGLLALAKHIGAATVLAVPESQQIFRKKKTKLFDYDPFWLALGGRLNRRGDYRLPLELPRKEHWDTPTKRRAKYRRQHGFLDLIRGDCLQSLALSGFQK